MYKRIMGLMALIILLTSTVSLADGGISVGAKITFGKYQQHMITDNTPASSEPIVWRVLANDGNRVLLLSEQALVGMPYNSKEHFLNDVTWEKCSLRTWLNGEFLNDAFSAEEQQAILPTVISTPDYNDFAGLVVSGGNDTTDKVFLLSSEEAIRYFATDSLRICSPTEYAVFTGAGKKWGFYNDDSYEVAEYVDNVCWWWLRSPGQIGHYTACCRHDGGIDYFGRYSGDVVLSVRPAIWIDQSALNNR